jgi:DNA repair exonuclease SbcCD ATPase subunit
VDPNLSSNLQSDHDAILNDLREAKQVAATLEVQLAGKSKEVMHLKFLLEQTKTNLAHMHDGIAAMRKERHKLANTAMRTPVMDIMLARVTTERDQLRAELNRVVERPTGVKPASALFLDERDHQIADLTSELFTLRKELAAMRRVESAPASVAPEASPVAPTLEAASGETQFDAADMEVIPTETMTGFRRKV